MFPEVNNQNRVFLISTLFEIVEVVRLPKIEDKNNYIDLNQEKFQEFMVWEWLGPENESAKVGDKVQLEMKHCRLLKQMGPIITTPRNWVKGELTKEMNKTLEFNKNQYKKMAENFNPSLVKEIKAELKSLVEDDEVAYRCFYNSFKMYRCRDYVIDMAKMLISLGRQTKFECTTNEELLKTFTEMKFDHVLIKNLTKILNTEFALNRNDGQAWYNDTEVLFSGYFLFSKAVDYMVRFCERLEKGDAFFQKSGRFGLSWEEAGAMEIWGGISFLRTCDEEAHKTYSQMIKKK